jgi:hypothetical protein
MIEQLGRLLLTVADKARTVDFYPRVPGMRHQVVAQGRRALVFGQQHCW